MKRILRLVQISILCMISIFMIKGMEESAWADSLSVYERAMISATPEGHWVKNSGKWSYQLLDGTQARNCYYRINNQVYGFDPNGYMKTGWILEQSEWYYATAYGDLIAGKWLRYNSNWYYIQSNGVMLSNRFLQLNGVNYYLYASGKMASSKWLRVDNTYYWFNASGNMSVKTWKQINGIWYYFDQYGAMLSDVFFQTHDLIYYFFPSGKMACSQWVKKDNVYYWFKDSGRMAFTEWLWIGGSKYYFFENGRMAASCWIGDSYVDSNGRMVTNTYVDGEYIDGNGVKQNDSDRQVIFVGDSRTVGMMGVVSNSKVAFVARGGMGYPWLIGEGIYYLRQKLEAYPNAKVVLCLGVNDMYDDALYVSYYRNLMKEYQKVKFYVMSVNPVDKDRDEDNMGYNITNPKIVAFNNVLRANFLNCYIDTWLYLMNHGFQTIDGLHYTDATYLNIFNYTMNLI